MMDNISCEPIASVDLLQKIKGKSQYLSQRTLLTLSIFFLLVITGCGGSPGSDLDYVALGASDATGVGATPLTNGYVFRIEDRLDQECEETGLYNLGIPAAEADLIHDTELQVAVDLGPGLVTVWIGANDLVAGRSVESFQSDLSDILMTLAKDTNARVYVANLPQLTKLPRFQDEPDDDVTEQRIVAYNTAIRDAVLESNSTLVDLSAFEVSKVLVSKDGFHPNDQGHKLIADIFLMSILENGCP